MIFPFRKAAAGLIFSLIAITSLSSQICTIDTVGLSAYLATLNLNEDGSLTFAVQNQTSTFAVLHGNIDAGTPQAVDNFIAAFPNVTTLVFMQVPGSRDDDANLMAAQKLRTRGYKTYLPAVEAYPQDAFIASGGVDLFLSGTTRVIDVNAELGVHSWSDGTNEAKDFPVGHENHLPYINYYVLMGFSQLDAEAFYYFTINAAPASGIHIMTEAEIIQYKLRICPGGAGEACTHVDYTSLNNINANMTIRAQNKITLNKSITGTSNVFFYAGNEIILNAGAEIALNAQMESHIENCTN